MGDQPGASDNPHPPPALVLAGPPQGQLPFMSQPFYPQHAMPFVPQGYAAPLYPAFSAPGGEQQPYMMPYMMPPAGVMPPPALIPAAAASQSTPTTGKSSPNKQTPTGAWEFGVEVIYKNTRNEFETDTDASWEAVCGLIHNAVKKEKLDKTMMEIMLKVAKESGPAIQVSNEEEFNKIRERIKLKAANARSRAAALEVRITIASTISTTKSVRKRTRQDDVPPPPPPEIVGQVRALQKLEDELNCQKHRGCCFINGKLHRRVNLERLTVWAKAMDEGRASVTQVPAHKLFKRNDWGLEDENEPDFKKPRRAQESISPERDSLIPTAPEMPPSSQPRIYGAPYLDLTRMRSPAKKPRRKIRYRAVYASLSSVLQTIEEKYPGLIPAIGKRNLAERFARSDEVSLTPEKQLAVVNGIGAVRAQVVRHYARCAVADLHGFAREETPDFEADIAQVMTKKSPVALVGEENIFDSDGDGDMEKGDFGEELEGRDDDNKDNEDEDDIETGSEYSEEEIDELDESE
ncbi:hypothetical protein BDN72DRAFT_958004 [Pluteus cervinus]|uniref:Uncharacterized protein n=1 Tax=Pluteus cervinus TaxID=181527 RepID=A0ACD3B0P6_9AGAR|nr:hypothetical protein BDN72DRAFT_958004 [Pluteus cervinus]